MCGDGLVSPGTFERKVIVAPNSPIERAKPSTSPASTPGTLSGNVTLQNTRAGRAPSVRAAPSSRTSTASIDSRIARAISGSAITDRTSALQGTSVSVRVGPGGRTTVKIKTRLQPQNALPKIHRDTKTDPDTTQQDNT